jgi:chemotaxis protein CheZ
MSKKKTPENGDIYQDVSKITLEGLAGITQELEAFYAEMAQKFQPTLSGMAAEEIPEASDQLQAIVETTEEAATRIMDNLEDMQGDQEIIQAELQNLAAAKRLTKKERQSLEVVTATMNGCQDKIIGIFEQLSFQDLTGQRIKRLVSLVQSIEVKVHDILEALGQTAPAAAEKDAPASKENLKGPQRSGQGMDQSAIDALLAEL